MSFSVEYFKHVAEVAKLLSSEDNIAILERIIAVLNAAQRYNGRIFFVGVGGSGANGAHGVNDFRKLCGIEAYNAIDNQHEVTARINDGGWETGFADWLRCSKLCATDVLFVLSVGGGHVKRNVSINIIQAINFARGTGATIVGIVGKQDGYVLQASKDIIVIPTVHSELITPLTESFQSVILHLLVSHPLLKKNKTVW